MGNKGATAIAEALKVNLSLTTLQLDRNEIGNEGASAIAEVKVNSSLGTLYLGFNNIGKEGTSALYEAMRYNPSLSQIDFIQRD
jgi:hypothetical protein